MSIDGSLVEKRSENHILDAIATIESYVIVGHDEFMSKSHWQDAVIRQLEIVGEATKRLSRELCS